MRTIATSPHRTSSGTTPLPYPYGFEVTAVHRVTSKSPALPLGYPYGEVIANRVGPTVVRRQRGVVRQHRATRVGRTVRPRSRRTARSSARSGDSGDDSEPGEPEPHPAGGAA